MSNIKKLKLMKHFRIIFAALLLISATALIVSCSSDEEQGYNSEAKEYAYTSEEMQKIQTFMEEYEVSLPGLVTSSEQPLPSVDDMLDLVKTIASLQSAVSHPVDMAKNSATFSNMAKNNLVMSSDVETYSGSTSGTSYNYNATINYTVSWKNVDITRGGGEVKVSNVNIDDSNSKWDINYIGFSYGFSGAYYITYTLKFVASKKLNSTGSYPFQISGSCNMFSGK